MQSHHAIFWLGVVLTAIGVAWFAIKWVVVWDSCHNVQDGGVPTLDFPVICPVPFAVATWAFLKYAGHYPFIGFAYLVYLALVVVCVILFILCERHGKPVRERQFRAILEKSSPTGGGTMISGKRHVNFRDLRPLSGFYFLSNEELSTIADSVSPNDEQSVRQAIRTYIIPRLRVIEARWPGHLAQLLISLQYFLATGMFPVEDTFYAEEPPFDHPSDPLDYYRWAWRELAPDKDPSDITLSDFVVDDDGSAP